MSSAYSRMTGNRGDDLADRVIYLMLRLFEEWDMNRKNIENTYFLMIITAIFPQF